MCARRLREITKQRIVGGDSYYRLPSRFGCSPCLEKWIGNGPIVKLEGAVVRIHHPALCRPQLPQGQVGEELFNSGRTLFRLEDTHRTTPL
ncbi:hypothetical protein CEXT_758011 [Caerostris extrusa]|uniref:Uncharacterized protein n=1 Tax=Caerostris extrusa TaxID=172846 RepID=A0AAV4U7T0_CAEEX|nr:hypothetical protein CEXT_758011 [Caerostris extrusa]